MHSASIFSTSMVRCIDETAFFELVRLPGSRIDRSAPTGIVAADLLFSHARLIIARAVGGHRRLGSTEPGERLSEIIYLALCFRLPTFGRRQFCLGRYWCLRSRLSDLRFLGYHFCRDRRSYWADLDAKDGPGDLVVCLGN